jgi:hypothetical protein
MFRHPSRRLCSKLVLALGQKESSGVRLVTEFFLCKIADILFPCSRRGPPVSSSLRDG